MNRTFIEVPQFTKKWQMLGLTDDDLKALEEALLNDPKTGDAILSMYILKMRKTI